MEKELTIKWQRLDLNQRPRAYYGPGSVIDYFRRILPSFFNSSSIAYHIKAAFKINGIDLTNNAVTPFNRLAASSTTDTSPISTAITAPPTTLTRPFRAHLVNRIR